MKLPAFFACLLATAVCALAGSLIPVGVARVDISPAKPVPLMGYAARAKLPPPAEIAQRIHARALAIGGDEDAAILLTIDNCILPGAITEEVRRRLAEKLRIPAERIALTVTHTHSAPWLSGAAPNIYAADIAAPEQAAIDNYTGFFTDRLEEVARTAFADRQPARLAWGKGSAGFAKNRRTPGGPVDHEMPLLRVSTPEGKVRAVFVSYACHCTTLGGEFNAVHGDWAGVAAQAIERDLPDTVALVAVGAGADSNPDPRGTLELAVKHGETIAEQAKQLVLATKLTPLQSAPECRLKSIQLPFAPHFSREEWTRRAAEPGIVGYHARKWLRRLDAGETLPVTLPYPVQTWTFGEQLAIVFLGGEVVVDYSLRLKRELDGHRLWINAYANDVPCYIPSRRILAEGGYEAESSLWYYDRPQRLAPEIEDLIVGTVLSLLPKFFIPDPKELEQPAPKTPAAALETLRPRAGFDIELVASEPLIESPVAIDFGADGRLWVCEMRDYPSGMDGLGMPGGRIKVLSDTDGDGRFDSAEIWAEDLPFPTGLMAWRDGVLVCAAPDVWFISKTRREKLLSGFATDNFQARVSGLRWGLDGWVYASGGLFGGEITVAKTGKVIDCARRDFRFKPDTGEFEPLSGVSQQGRVRDDFGEWFGNDNSTLLFHFPLHERYARRNPHAAMPAPRVVRSKDADPSRVFPISRLLTRFNDPGATNRITSGCGPEIYRDTLFGAAFDGNTFVCEPVHNVVRRAELRADGVTFSTARGGDEQRSEFLASTDNWFRPVEVRTGPDGALWVVDMYRFVVEHPRWIPPERLKELDVRAGAERGRIWRVFPIGMKPTPIRDLTKLPASELARVAGSANGVERDLAHRLLLAGNIEADAARELEQIAAWGTDRGKVQALAILHQLGKLSPEALSAALRNESARVRRAAIWLHEGLAEPTAQLLGLRDDPDEAVRFQLALTLGEFTTPAAGEALAQLAIRDVASEWHRAAILSSVLGSPRAFAERFAALSADTAALKSLRAAVVATLVGAEQTDALAEWTAATFPAEAAPLAGSRIAEALDLLAALAANPDVMEALARDVTSPSAQALKRLERELPPKAGALAADPQLPEAARLAALNLLAETARTDAARRGELIALLDADLPEPLLKAVLAGLQRQEATALANELLASWPSRSPAQRLTLLPILLSRETWSGELLSALERGEVSPAELSPLQRQQLRDHKDGGLRGRAVKLLPNATSDRSSVIARFKGAVELAGVAERGAAHFDQRCASCHALGGRGHAVGPDLGPFRAKPAADFLAAILDPNAAIEPRFAGWIAELKGERVMMGIVRDESSAALTIAQPGGATERVPRAEIKRLTPSPTSLMPVGLEEGLTPQDLADLIAWIRAAPAAGSASAAAR